MINYVLIYLFILYVSNIFAADAMKSTTDSIWTNLSHKSSILGQMLHGCCVTWSYLCYF